MVLEFKCKSKSHIQ